MAASPETIALAVFVRSSFKPRHVTIALVTLLGIFKVLIARIVRAKKRTCLVQDAFAVHPDVFLVLKTTARSAFVVKSTRRVVGAHVTKLVQYPLARTARCACASPRFTLVIIPALVMLLVISLDPAVHVRDAHAYLIPTLQASKMALSTRQSINIPLN